MFLSPLLLCSHARKKLKVVAAAVLALNSRVTPVSSIVVQLKLLPYLTSLRSNTF